MVDCFVRREPKDGVAHPVSLENQSSDYCCNIEVQNSEQQGH